MNESMLRSFLQILAGFALYYKNQPVKLVRKYVEGFIERSFGKKMVDQKLKDFDVFLSNIKDIDRIESHIQTICNDITKEFSQQQRFLLLIQILNFFSFNQQTQFGGSSNSESDDILDDVANWLNLNKQDYINCKHFAFGQFHSVPQKEKMLIVAAEDPSISDVGFFECDGIRGHIYFLYLASSNLIIFDYNGTSKLEMYGKPIFSHHTYVFPSGLILWVIGSKAIYYGEVYRAIINQSKVDSVSLRAQDITYKYRNSDQGIQNLTFSATSGEMYGILGGSGVGKSTLIKLLCGVLKPQQGQVLVNGNNLHDEPNLYSGIIGVLHQEECLFEELTVYENLFLSAKASLGKISDSQIRKLCDEKLLELDLFETKNNLVGPPDNRQLSGGQRKRLAIAMEIIRDPKILFVDEPTSGLSSADSEMVMNILKNIALGGKLVVVNIHQPSSDVFKLFDGVLIIDKGGMPIFDGHPIEAILHFKRETDRVDKHQSGCECCGAIKPDSIFDMMEERNVDELGHKRLSRKFSPTDWHKIYLQNIQEQSSTQEIGVIPKSEYSLPNPISQFITFFRRNLLTKIRNFEFLFFALILPPILSIIISIFLRYSISQEFGTDDYTLYSNPNIPSFFLMSILSAIFFGLIISCEDIIRDKRVITREKSIGISIKSLYNAKLLFLILLSAIQSLMFALPGALILELKQIVLPLWLILFLLSLLGNLLGLILSSALKSIVAIYILVPFLLIPQILFSGLVVRFDNLNPRFTSPQNVPIVGEIMPSRWAIEAVIVHFFVNNRYNKPLFSHNFNESELRFRLLYLIPELNEFANQLAEDSGIIGEDDIERLKSGMLLLYKHNDQPELVSIFENWNHKSIHSVINYLGIAKKETANRYSTLKYNRDKFIENLYPNSQEGREHLTLDKNKYYNLAIEDLVRNKFFTQPFIIHKNTYIQKSDPIFQLPTSINGRSHLYSPYKQIGNLLFETYWFNAFVLVLFIILLYLTFLYNIFHGFLKRISNKA